MGRRHSAATALGARSRSMMIKIPNGSEFVQAAGIQEVLGRIR
jgi:hypothetical protein